MPLLPLEASVFPEDLLGSAAPYVSLSARELPKCGRPFCFPLCERQGRSQGRLLRSPGPLGLPPTAGGERRKPEERPRTPGRGALIGGPPAGPRPPSFAAVQ